MTLPLTPCGLDFGNGWIKICLDGKASNIPNWTIATEPKGRLNNQNTLIKPMAFALEIPNHPLHWVYSWFGQDTLSQPGYQEIDTDKYRPAYIKMMFKAILQRWLTQHNVSPEWLKDKRLNIICGMPT